MQSARLLGIAIDRLPERLELARTHARTHAAETTDYSQVDSVTDLLKDMTGGRGPDACIDAVGTEAHGEGIEYAYDRVKQAYHPRRTGFIASPPASLDVSYNADDIAVWMPVSELFACGNGKEPPPPEPMSGGASGGCCAEFDPCPENVADSRCSDAGEYCAAHRSRRH